MSHDPLSANQIGAKEVCGCPLDPLFPSRNKECQKFCYQAKKSCVKHYYWEKLRRAEIDQEKLNLVGICSQCGQTENSIW